jgi:hypothetical protein
LRGGLGAGAALRLGLLAGGLLALQLALGTRAVGGLGALAGALQLLAHGRALGFRGRAGGVALGRGANGLALGAVLLLAVVLGAADRAGGLLAVNDALGALDLLTLHFALWPRAHGVADGGAGRVIALPTALRVALGLGGSDGTDQAQNSDDENSAHGVRHED